MKISPRQWVIIGVLGLLALGLTGKLVADGMRDYLGQRDNEIRQCELKRTDLRRKIEENRAYLEKWKSVSEFQNESLEDRRTKFSAYLDGLEAEREFAFDNLGAPSERPLAGSTAFQELSYELRFSADLKDLLHFLAKLDTSGRLLRIDKMEITRIAPGFRSRFAAPAASNKQLSVLIVVTIPAIKSEMTPLTSGKLLP